MRKSISKLIVAGLSLALSVTAFAAPQHLTKVTKGTQVPASSATAKVASVPKNGVKTLAPVRKADGQFTQVRKRALKPQGNVLPQLHAPLHVGAMAEVYAANIYSTNPDFTYGIYQVPTDGVSNEAVLIAESSDLTGVYGAVMVDGKYYVNVAENFMGYYFIYHFIYDSETWEMIGYVPDEMNNLSTLAIDMTYDATTDKVYGCFRTNEGGMMFASQDLVTFQTTRICDLDDVYTAVAAAPDGKLYAIDGSGILYTLNKSNGQRTMIGDTGVSPQYMGGGVIDPKTGVFYWSVSDDYGGYIYTVDTATAKATLLADLLYEDELVGLVMPTALTEAGAPAAVEDLSVVFEGDSHVGVISFVLPTTDTDGNAISKNLKYTITRNGDVIKEGEGFPGTEVKYTDVVPEAGNYVYMVTCSLNGKDSPKVKTELWVGTDAPVVAKGLNLVYDNGKFTLTWDPVTSSVHSGTLSGDITYTVSLCTGDQVVAFDRELTDCSWTVEVAAPADLTVYYATVKACTDKASSGIAVSNNIVLGAVSTPYVETFEEESSIDTYTIIDGNNDGYTWYWGYGRLAIRYNSDEDMDDWLITPAVKLEAGKQYTFSTLVGSASSYYPERIEVCVGTKATADGLTQCILEPTDIEDQTTVKAKFAPEADGNYYFGIHGISDADMYYLYVYGVSVSEGISVDAPVACSTVIATPDRAGALKATLTYVTPKKTISGDPTELTKVEIYRDADLIYVDEAPAAGKRCTYVDEAVPASGVYTWNVIAYNEAGAGEEASAEAFVGIGIPEPVENADVIENGDSGEVVISWEAPTEDIEGHYLDPSNVTYTILDAEGEVIADGITETSITYQALQGEGRDFVYYVIYAVTEAGASSEEYTPMIAIGTPMGLPIAESFDGKSLTLPMMADTSGGCDLAIVDEEDLGIPDADNTGGMMVFVGNYGGDQAELYTAKVKLDAEVPVLSFSTYALASGDSNELNVVIRDCETGDLYIADQITMNSGAIDAWTDHQVNLSPLSGKSVQIGFIGVIRAYRYILLDNIKVAQPADIDLAVAGIKAPAKVKANIEFNIDVTVVNYGAKAVNDYTVEVSLNGEVVGTVQGEAIEPFTSAVVSLPYTFSPVCADTNVFTAKVICEGDADLTNNASGEAAVDVKMPNYPVATDLTAQMQGESVVLNWSEPDTSDLGIQTVTDDFEEYDAFAFADLGDWLLVDEDGGQTGGISDVEFPGIPTYQPFAYFVMNYVMVNLNDAYAAHSGEQYLSTMYNIDGGPQSDWLISPELSGNAQTISFFARSITEQYGYESFDVYYSTTDADLDSFEFLAEVSAVPVDWTEYTYDLPEGAKYFAVVCTSQDKFMLHIDDVTYEAAGASAVELSLVGYNVYRNGVKINDAPVAETTYVDAEGSGNDVYVVTAVYAEGESAPSNEAQAQTTGINVVKAANATVKVVERTIQIAGAQGIVSVYNAEGKQLYKAAAETLNTVTVAPGVYVVKAGKTVNKVIVK